MSVRVLIQRDIEQADEAKLTQILTQLRARAVMAEGYISGETLRSVDNPKRFLVVSNWKSLDAWKQWRKDPQRLEIQKQLDPLLIAPECATVYARL